MNEFNKLIEAKKFNPNDINDQKYIWGTYIPDRTPKFKVYTNRGHAISALKNASEYSEKYRTIPEECTLWKREGLEWKEVRFKHTYSGREKLKLYD